MSIPVRDDELARIDRAAEAARLPRATFVRNTVLDAITETGE